MNSVHKRKNWIAGILGAVLLLIAGMIYFDAYELFSMNGKKVITIGSFSDSYWDVQNGYSYYILNDAIELFEEMYPNVKVEYVSGIMKEDYSEWLSEKLLSGNAPDLFFVLPEDFNDLSELGALHDLASFIKKDASFDKDAFYSSALEYGQFNRHQYALPYECAPKLMFVNKSILDKEGIEIPDNTWTWDDFYRICDQVSKDTDHNGMLDQFGVVGYTWQDAFDSNAVELFDQNGTSCNLSGSNVEEAILFIEDLERINGGYSISSKEFDLGNIVFQPMSFSEYRAYRSYPLSIKKYSGFEWGCIPMPAGPQGDNISKLDTLLIAMNENTKNEDYVWDFMKVLTCDSRIQSEIFEYSEGVSVLKEVTESDETLQRLIEGAGDSSSLNLSTLSSAVENAVIASRFRNYDDTIAEVDRAVTSIINGNSNIGTELIIWNRDINKKLKNHRL